MGAKHQPSYRIVVADSRSPRDGRYLDQVGFYNPLENPAVITLDQQKTVDWLRKGAQPTETVEKLLSKFNITPSEVRKGEAPVFEPGVKRAPAPATEEQPAPRRTRRTASAPAASSAPVDAPAAEAPVAESTTAPEETEATAAEEPTPAGEGEGE
jgi:small subunit ribosomal protein S16